MNDKSKKGRIFGLSKEMLSQLSIEELEELNSKTLFVRDAMPLAWLEYAEELMESAEVLWKHKDSSLRLEAEGEMGESHLHLAHSRKVMSISRSYILLAGFALENLIKGILVAQDPSHINQGKLSADLRSHNLLQLADKMNDLSLNKEEKRICKIVQDAIPYWGRYPIPLEHQGVTPEIAIDEQTRQVFLELHYKLGKQIHKMARDGWDSGVGPRSVKFRSARYGDEIDYSELLFDEDID